jgi:hypothetical protein
MTAKPVIDNLVDEISNHLLEKAAAVSFDLRGPVETQYGFGWEPTVTFWSEDRRMHFYLDFGIGSGGTTIKRSDGVIVEVAEIQPDPGANSDAEETDSLVKRGMINTPDEAWNVVDCFLRQHCGFEELPDHSWKVDMYDHDKFIPHPPDMSNPANIVSLVETMKQVGEPWHPPRPSNIQLWLQRLSNWIRKRST